MTDPAPAIIRLHHAVYGHVLVDADDAVSIASWKSIGYVVAGEMVPVLSKLKKPKPAKTVDADAVAFIDRVTG